MSQVSSAAWLVLSVAVLVEAGCFDPNPIVGVSCSARAECPPSQLCVNSECVCDRTCGDVDGDGDADSSDLRRLEEIDEANQRVGGCVFQSGDINADDRIDSEDVRFMSIALDRDLLEPRLCDPCPRLCGDLTGSSSLDQNDVNVLADILNGVIAPDVCLAASSDIDRDGGVDDTDRSLLQQAVDGQLQPQAEGCLSWAF